MAAGAKYLTTDELAARYDHHVTNKTLRNWRATTGNPGPAYSKIGNKILYDIKDVEAWEKSHKFRSTSEYKAQKATA